MSESLGTRIPYILSRELTSGDPPAVAVPLLTIDEQGIPHLALISFYEIILEDGLLYFYLREASRTNQFLAVRPHCTLVFIRQHYCLYLKGIAALVAGAPPHVVFSFRPLEVLRDEIPPEETETRLISTIGFELSERQKQHRLRVREGIRRQLFRRQGRQDG